MSTEREAPYVLRSHIGDLAGTMGGQKFTETDYAVANGIFNDPRTHMQALVDAGVLEMVTSPLGGGGVRWKLKAGS